MFQSDDRKGSHTFLVPPGKWCLAQPGIPGLEFYKVAKPRKSSDLTVALKLKRLLESHDGLERRLGDSLSSVL